MFSVFCLFLFFNTLFCLDMKRKNLSDDFQNKLTREKNTIIICKLRIFQWFSSLHKSNYIFSILLLFLPNFSLESDDEVMTNDKCLHEIPSSSTIFLAFYRIFVPLLFLRFLVSMFLMTFQKYSNLTEHEKCLQFIIIFDASHKKKTEKWDRKMCKRANKTN